ncbi:MAG TPA: TetR/AcrR family transcriptional regulator C-terminal domain-containing protein [Acidimicrobiales bacterium]
MGRPARINRQLIAEAAHEIGLADLTLRAVADKLGVSITGLYHHIEDKDDLMRLAAEYSSTRVPLPEDRGQHWALWLAEWARYSRQVFVAEPGLLGQYLEGAISAEAIADKVDAMLGLMVRQGFSVQEAQAAFDLVNSAALGSAIQAIREERAARAGRAPLAEHHRVLALHDPAELPYLRLLLAERSAHPAPRFRDQLSTVLIGIATERGEAWEPIAAMIELEP